MPKLPEYVDCCKCITAFIYFSLCCSPSLSLFFGGEVGFKAMSESLGWAKCPILDFLPPSLPVTLVCGGGSWMDSATEARVAELRPNSYTCTVVRWSVKRHLSLIVVGENVWLKEQLMMSMLISLRGSTYSCRATVTL
ncbi:unnamed protein product [Coregonus sp. 'balchen']|nr:unnamed protein product [Coregonus sp. 'balchen']